MAMEVGNESKDTDKYFIAMTKLRNDDDSDYRVLPLVKRYAG